MDLISHPLLSSAAASLVVSSLLRALFIIASLSVVLALAERQWHPMGAMSLGLAYASPLGGDEAATATGGLEKAELVSCNERL